MSGKITRVLMTVLLTTVFLALFLVPPIRSWWTAWHGESDTITGVVLAARDGQTYLTVSGWSEYTSDRPKSDGGGTRTTAFPRVTTYRLSDGEPVATRQYAPVFFRWWYLDTVVYAVAAGGPQVWVVTSDAEPGLHAVDPVTLEDVVDPASLVARVPGLASGLFLQSATSRSPIALDGDALLFRVNAGAWLALDAATLAVEDRGTDADDVDEVRQVEPLRPLAAVESAVDARSDLLEPDVVLTVDADERPDASVAFVITQSSLDREQTEPRVSRWEVTPTGAAPSWTTPLEGVDALGSDARAWRLPGGLTVLWWEEWLFGFDDATGTIRWQRRL